MNETNEFFTVQVDSYDRPFRETLFRLLLSSAAQSTVSANCPHDVSLFSACKSVGEMLPGNRVWVTGVVPIVLDLISDFKPQNMTFLSQISDALGFRERILVGELHDTRRCTRLEASDRYSNQGKEHDIDS